MPTPIPPKPIRQASRSLVLTHLYPSLMNLYGDRGNIMALRERCAARDISLTIQAVEIGDDWNPEGTDIVFIGGGQDREQRRIQPDLVTRAGPLCDYRDDDGVVLAVCGGYQMFGGSYRDIDGEVMDGAGLFDIVSVHPGRNFERCVGNVVALWEDDTLVGFENHGGRSYLNEGAEPLANVVAGFGNNGGDGTEGARIRNAFGTYLHGALLPKNPRLADRLVQLALDRRHADGDVHAPAHDHGDADADQAGEGRPLSTVLAPLDDQYEGRAHAEALHAGLRR